MHISDALIKGILVGLFMAISVGPTLFAVIRYSLNFGYKAGLAFVIGVSFSDALYITVANVAASWLRYLAPYEHNIAIGGAIVLMAMGATGLLRRHKPKRPSAAPVKISGGHYFKIWLNGFLINTLNPGVLITWLGAVTITSANSSGFYRFVLFGTALIIILSIDFSKVFLAEKIKKALTVRRIIYVQRFSSFCILMIGLTLFLSTAFSHHGTDKGEQSRIDKILTR